MILLDSDILLDIALHRVPFYEHSADLLKLAVEGKIQVAVTPIILSNIYYLISSKSNDAKASSFLENTLQLSSFLPHEQVDFSEAFNSDFSDKEDAINYFTAKRLNVNSIITRNIRDFKQSDLPILTPSEFLWRMNEM